MAIYSSDNFPTSSLLQSLALAAIIVLYFLMRAFVRGLPKKVRATKVKSKLFFASASSHDDAISYLLKHTDGRRLGSELAEFNQFCLLQTRNCLPSKCISSCQSAIIEVVQNHKYEYKEVQKMLFQDIFSCLQQQHLPIIDLRIEETKARVLEFRGNLFIEAHNGFTCFKVLMNGSVNEFDNTRCCSYNSSQNDVLCAVLATDSVAEVLGVRKLAHLIFNDSFFNDSFFNDSLMNKIADKVIEACRKKRKGFCGHITLFRYQNVVVE